ncbi:integral membrane protein Sed5p [[Candida] railenensis]|uniref:Integral membrane protein Sed5p n=1 Tax=[Candida] railenensis TaxID=45579 RepID=A0A9P0VX37_9ASCO|nr:integral membrane protein Sed5p [[Candida] railenensis]
MTSIQNRTFEFQQCVSSFQKLNKGKQQQALQPQTASQKSQFSIQAGIIAKDIAHTTDLLSKLALLAKRKPLFDDKPIEIGELTYVIKQDIFKIEENIKNLQKYTKGDHTIQVDSQINQYSKNVLNLLNSKMKNISGEFKNVLEIRQKNELVNKNRTQQFLSAAAASTNRSQSPQSNLSLGENPYALAASSSGSNYNPAMDQNGSATGGNPYGDEFLSIPDQTRQLLLMEEQNGNQYLQERNRAVETIESTINEVGNLFQQLATMVSEQGEVIQRIDSNVEDINLNISGAQRELLKYYNHISSNRMLFLKIFGVLIVFFLLWVLVS